MTELQELIQKFDKSDSDRFFGFARKSLISLLPGGRFFNYFEAEFKSKKEVENAILVLSTLLQDLEDGDTSVETEKRIIKSVSMYLQTFERVLIDSIDLSNIQHAEILETLNKLLPPPTNKSNLVVLVAGPSAAGKDTLMSAVCTLLRARGYDVQFLKKYTTRKPRKGEESSVTTYYDFLSKEEFSELEKSNEIFHSYSKYSNLYGLSRSELRRLFRQGTIVIVIVSDFHRIEDVADKIKKEDSMVVSILIDSPYDDCSRRMPHRGLDPEDAWRRLDEAKSDCKRILLHKEGKEHRFNVVVKNSDEDAFNDSSRKIYHYIEGIVKADIYETQRR